MDTNRYKELARLHAETDYGNPDSIRHCNQAADEMRKMASMVSNIDGDAVSSFAILLNDRFAAAWAAFHLLEVVLVDGPVADRCLEVINREAEGAGPNATGCRLWLNTRNSD